MAVETTDTKQVSCNPLFTQLTLLALALAVITILFGAVLGIAFGLGEDGIKSGLKESALAVRETTYQSDDAAIKTVLDKSWNYLKRAHLHAGAMGTTATVLIVLLALLHAPRLLKQAASVGLGLGALGYSFFWLWAGYRAPGMGGTTPAKESLAWLAIPSSGLFVLSIIAVLLVIVVGMLRKNEGVSH